MLKKEDKRELNDLEKAQMASADTYQLDFYGIQKGDMVDVEGEESEAEMSKRVIHKMMEEGLSKMMEDEDSAMSKMMYKMMRKMMDEDSDQEVSKDQMELPGISKAIVVEAEAPVAEAPVAEAPVAEAPATRGRDALMGWLNN